MKQLTFCALMILVMIQPASAALKDEEALKKAKALWGSQGWIGSGYADEKGNWDRYVGFKSEGCNLPFTILGTGFNTWDAAFVDADLNPPSIGGPFKGTVKLQVDTWDSAGVTVSQVYIDSKKFGPETLHYQTAITPFLKVDVPINTANLANGTHVICLRVWNQRDMTISSSAFLFKTDQAILANPTAEWWPKTRETGSVPSFTVK